MGCLTSKTSNKKQQQQRYHIKLVKYVLEMFRYLERFQMATTLLLLLLSFNVLKQRYVYKIYHILFFSCFVNRASRYVHLKKNQLDVQFIFSIFRETTLHVSGYL